MRTDPRVRLLLIVLLTTLAVLALDVAYLGAVVAAGLIADICFKVNLKDAVKRLKHFLWLLVFITVVQSLTVKGGTPLVYIGGVNLITTRGLQYSLEFILRMSVIIQAGLIAATADGREMADGMLKLHVPYELVFMSGIALRFIPIFRDEFNSRLNAITMRGIDIKKLPLSSKLKLYSYLISPTVTGCILRSEELARSMTARGFRAEKKRTMYRELKMTAADWCLTVFSVSAAAGYLYVMYRFGIMVSF